MSAPLRVDRFLVESAALRGNRLGDPATREVFVLVPPGYDATAQRYPVVLLLAAFTGFGATFLQRACWDEAFDQRLARLFAAGCPPALFVLPDASTRLGGSQYVNSPAQGRYEDHVMDEVLVEVARRYRTLPAPGGRAVVGKSSGGFGALHLALQRPGAFAAVGCHSGDLGFELCYAHDFPACANALVKAGGIAPFLAQFVAKPKRSPEEFAAISVLALAAAYSPDLTQPDGFVLPFEPRTCELRPDVFARWRAFDPLARLAVAADAAALRALRLLFVDCGARDEYHLHFGARRFARDAAARGIPVVHEEFDDGHRGTSYRYDVSLPRIVRALDPAAP